MLEWNSDNDVAFKRQQKINEMRKNVTKFVWTVTGTNTAKRKCSIDIRTGIWNPSKRMRMGWTLSQEIWNPGLWNLGIQLKEFGIPLRLESVVQVPLTNNPESSCTWVRNQRRRIENPRLLGFLYMGDSFKSWEDLLYERMNERPIRVEINK